MTRTGSDYIGDFNSENLGSVRDIKKEATDLIDTIIAHTPAGRRQAIAITYIEQAAMMAVKAIFEDQG